MNKSWSDEKIELFQKLILKKQKRVKQILEIVNCDAFEKLMKLRATMINKIREDYSYILTSEYKKNQEEEDSLEKKWNISLKSKTSDLIMEQLYLESRIKEIRNEIYRIERFERK